MPLPDARLAGAPERRFLREVVHERIVHARVAGFQPARHRLALRDVCREHTGVEPVAAVVGELDRLLLVPDLHERKHRAKGLFLHHVHRVIDFGQDRRLEEPPRAGP